MASVALSRRVRKVVAYPPAPVVVGQALGVVLLPSPHARLALREAAVLARAVAAELRSRFSSPHFVQRFRSSEAGVGVTIWLRRRCCQPARPATAAAGCRGPRPTTTTARPRRRTYAPRGRTRPAAATCHVATSLRRPLQPRRIDVPDTSGLTGVDTIAPQTR